MNARTMRQKPVRLRLDPRPLNLHLMTGTATSEVRFAVKSEVSMCLVSSRPTIEVQR